MIFNWLKVRKLRRHVDLQRECLKDIYVRLKTVEYCLGNKEKRWDKIERQVKMFRVFLLHLQMDIVEASDGSITFEHKKRFTKVGQDGAVERWN